MQAVRFGTSILRTTYNTPGWNSVPNMASQPNGNGKVNGNVQSLHNPVTPRKLFERIKHSELKAKTRLMFPSQDEEEYDPDFDILDNDDGYSEELSPTERAIQKVCQTGKPHDNTDTHISLMTKEMLKSLGNPDQFISLSWWTPPHGHVRSLRTLK